MIKTLHFVCYGCGKDRPCYVETNQEQRTLCDPVEDLKCILDETDQTSYNWEYYPPTIRQQRLSEIKTSDSVKRCTK